jgi:uncharacterized protein YjbI with pentapeptide repeats
MLTRRNRDILPQKTEPAPFAAKAKDLGALRDAVVDAASVSAGLWITYLFALFYFAIAAGAVTHRDLLLESPVKLPFLNVELPLKAFFILGPLVFLIVHGYVLLHFVLLAGKIGAFHLELQAQIFGDDARARLRRQLPSNIFVQSLAGPREVRTGIIGFLLRLIIEISLVAGPIALLILFQLQFLAYHSEWITSWQRIAVLIDLVLLWILWPRIARGETTGLVRSDFKRVKVRAWLLVSLLPFLLVVTIATFPGEWLEKLPPVRLIPTTWEAWTLPSVQAIQTARSGWATLHELLVAGEVNYVTGRPQSLWSNVLVVPNFEVGDRLSLRGRSLEGAALAFAHLRNADFTGASLAHANLGGADLREAKFDCEETAGGIPGFLPIGRKSKDIECAQLQGADFALARLQGASFDGAQLQGTFFAGAQLQGVNLDNAQMQGSELVGVPLQGASLNGTQLQGAWLRRAQLQGVELDYAQLQGIDLYGAQLQGAFLVRVQLQGASLVDAQLAGAALLDNYVWRTYPPSNTEGAFVIKPEPGPKYSGLNCTTSECDWSEESYATLKSLIENLDLLVRDRALQQIAVLGKPPFVAHEASAKAWKDLAEESARSAGSYFDTLAKTLKAIGCAAEGAPYVIGRVIPRLDWRFSANLSQEAEVAAAFLDETKCPGARGLSEENKGKLQDIRLRGLPTPPGPGAAAR